MMGIVVTQVMFLKCIFHSHHIFPSMNIIIVSTAHLSLSVSNPSLAASLGIPMVPPEHWRVPLFLIDSFLHSFFEKFRVLRDYASLAFSPFIIMRSTGSNCV